MRADGTPQPLAVLRVGGRGLDEMLVCRPELAQCIHCALTNGGELRLGGPSQAQTRHVLMRERSGVLADEHGDGVIEPMVADAALCILILKRAQTQRWQVADTQTRLR